MVTKRSSFDTIKKENGFMRIDHDGIYGEERFN